MQAHAYNPERSLPHWSGIFLLFILQPLIAQDLFDSVEHGYADNNGDAIHYVTQGSGPLVVILWASHDTQTTVELILRPVQRLLS